MNGSSSWIDVRIDGFGLRWENKGLGYAASGNGDPDQNLGRILLFSGKANFIWTLALTLE